MASAGVSGQIQGRTPGQGVKERSSPEVENYFASGHSTDLQSLLGFSVFLIVQCGSRQSELGARRSPTKSGRGNATPCPLNLTTAAMSFARNVEKSEIFRLTKSISGESVEGEKG